MASCLDGRGRNTGRLNKSDKTSGFQFVHLWSSMETSEIICWKELSPVLSLTHWIPLGEKMENPDEEPISGRLDVCSGLRLQGVYAFSSRHT